MSEPVKIEEKVRFWEEQDRINQELIPRVIRQSELLSQHIAEHENLQQILSDTIQKALEEQAKQYEANLGVAKAELGEQTQATLNKALEVLRQDARRTRNRLTTIAIISAAFAITALVVVLT